MSIILFKKCFGILVILSNTKIFWSMSVMIKWTCSIFYIFNCLCFNFFFHMWTCLKILQLNIIKNNKERLVKVFVKKKRKKGNRWSSVIQKSIWRWKTKTFKNRKKYDKNRKKALLYLHKTIFIFQRKVLS